MIKGGSRPLKANASYEDTKNEYTISASVYPIATEKGIKAVYYVEVTGGVFSETQICEAD